MYSRSFAILMGFFRKHSVSGLAPRFKFLARLELVYIVYISAVCSLRSQHEYVCSVVQSNLRLSLGYSTSGEEKLSSKQPPHPHEVPEEHPDVNNLISSVGFTP